MPNFPSDPVNALYQARTYPPMSHPLSDPATTSIAAWLGGLKTPHPATARILEIGCAAGHNLLPLARRWPAARFTGVDLSEEAIRQATRRAAGAEIRNAHFLAADLRQLDFPGETFDYIIAHGVFSWVADDAKAALLRFCAAHLSPAGIATISFNLSAGWQPRLPIVAAARKIQSDHGLDEISALHVLRTAIEDPETLWIIDDMLEKGANILFDDFGPVNDPWPFDRFAAAIAQAGLHWLGESDPAENIPASLDEKARESLQAFAADPLRMQLEIDALTARTFRSGVLCRADAPVSPRISSGIVLEMSVRPGLEEFPPAGEPMARFLAAVKAADPQSFPVRSIVENLGPHDTPALAREIFQAITRGQLRAGIEPVRYLSEPPPRPALDPFRLLCAREKLPLVDPWHVPCTFPPHHYELLAAMDGKNSVEQLATLAAETCPDLQFNPWLDHLARRGMLS